MSTNRLPFSRVQQSGSHLYASWPNFEFPAWAGPFRTVMFQKISHVANLGTLVDTIKFNNPAYSAEAKRRSSICNTIGRIFFLFVCMSRDSGRIFHPNHSRISVYWAHTIQRFGFRGYWIKIKFVWGWKFLTVQRSQYPMLFELNRIETFNCC